MENFAFIPIIACFTIYFAVKICYVFVMITDYVFYIIYASITNFELLDRRSCDICDF